MSYTYNITSKGQITIPKEFRDRLGLDKTHKATIRTNDRGEVVIEAPKTLQQVRELLSTSAGTDPLSEKEQLIGTYLAQKYDAC